MSTAVALPPSPIVRACTTAADVRNQGLEPITDVIAAADMGLALVPDFATPDEARELITRLVRLLTVCRERAKDAAGFVDLAHRRLQHAEHFGDFDAVPEVDSESGSGRALAARVTPLVLTLAQSRDRSELDVARRGLHAMFAEHGPALFEKRCTDRMRASVRLALEGEYRRWSASTEEAGS
jgi:hypothetical protein